MATYNIIYFEILTQKIYTLFDYTFQEVSKLKLLNINIIQSKYGIIIDETDHIMKNNIKEYWLTKTKDEVKFQQSTFPIDTYFEHIIFMDTPLIL